MLSPLPEINRWADRIVDHALHGHREPRRFIESKILSYRTSAKPAIHDSQSVRGNVSLNESPMRMRLQGTIDSPCGVIMQFRYLDQSKYREPVRAWIQWPENVIQYE